MKLSILPKRNIFERPHFIDNYFRGWTKKVELILHVGKGKTKVEKDDYGYWSFFRDKRPGTNIFTVMLIYKLMKSDTIIIL